VCPAKCLVLSCFCFCCCCSATNCNRPSPESPDRVAAMSRDPGIPTSRPHMPMPSQLPEDVDKDQCLAGLRFNIVLARHTLPWFGPGLRKPKRVLHGEMGISSPQAGLFTHSNFGSRSPSPFLLLVSSFFCSYRTHDESSFVWIMSTLYSFPDSPRSLLGLHILPGSLLWYFVFFGWLRVPWLLLVNARRLW